MPVDIVGSAIFNFAPIASSAGNILIRITISIMAAGITITA